VSGWSASAPVSSIKCAPSFWSGAFLFGRGTASCEQNRLIEGLASDWRRLDERIESLSGDIEQLAKRDAGCERLMSIPGVGPIISSAMVAAIGTGEGIAKGRDFAA
jgi:transposase